MAIAARPNLRQGWQPFLATANCHRLGTASFTNPAAREERGNRAGMRRSPVLGQLSR